MASRHQVGCINKTGHHDPHRRIQNIGGVNADGKRWKITEDEAIAGIESGKWSFYVSVNSRTVDVVIATHNGRKYLKTVADGLHPNNLLELPECP
jgi:hypothetical protein